MRVRAGIVVHDDSNTHDGSVAVRERERHGLNFGIHNQNALEE